MWARDLSGGRKAVALFNRGTQDATVSATFSALGITGTPNVRGVWHRADVTGMTTGLSVNVPYGGALVYVLSHRRGRVRETPKGSRVSRGRSTGASRARVS